MSDALDTQVDSTLPPLKMEEKNTIKASSDIDLKATNITDVLSVGPYTLMLLKEPPELIALDEESHMIEDFRKKGRIIKYNLLKIFTDILSRLAKTQLSLSSNSVYSTASIQQWPAGCQLLHDRIFSKHSYSTFTPHDINIDLGTNVNNIS